MNASGLWNGPVVTEVEPAGDFWEAEPEHQDYLQKLLMGIPVTSRVPTGSFRSAKR